MMLKTLILSNLRRPFSSGTRQTVYFVATLLALSLSSPRPVVASSDDCLGCHEPKADTVEVAHQVDPAKWSASVHAQAGLECTDCHEGNFDEVPHEGVVKPKCTNCHDEAGQEFQNSAHAQIVLKEGEKKTITVGGCNNTVDQKFNDKTITFHRR